MRLSLASLAVGIAVPSAMACTIVNQPPPREALKLAAVVFRGTVLSSKLLPSHPEMRGRQRFVVTVRVREYWKGNPGETVTLYDLAPGTDCMGAGLRPGNEYLIFAAKEAQGTTNLTVISSGSGGQMFCLRGRRCCSRWGP